MKIYTRTGDSGSTGLYGGPRVSKDDERIHAFGSVDELNAAIGVSRCHSVGGTLDSQLAQIQHELFSIGAELATPHPDDHQTRLIGDRHIARLENWIDDHEQGLPELRQFILPAGTAAAVALHLARSVCRRAERHVVTLAHREGSDVANDLIVYLNRLSDLLFVMSRVANRDAGVADEGWVRPDE